MLNLTWRLAFGTPSVEPDSTLRYACLWNLRFSRHQYLSPEADVYKLSKPTNTHSPREACTWVGFISQRGVGGVYDARLHGLLVTPSPVVLPADPIHLIRPEHPALLLLVAVQLGSEPAMVPSHRVSRCDVEFARLAVIGHQAPLPDDHRRVWSADVLVARVVQVIPPHGRHVTIGFTIVPVVSPVVVVVVKCEAQILAGQALGRVPASLRPPFVHHLDVEPCAWRNLALNVDEPWSVVCTSM